MQVNFWDFMVPPLMCGLGVEGPGSVETTAGEEWVGTAERDKSMPKAAGVKSNYCG
jgi:hypothetical protein